MVATQINLNTLGCSNCSDDCHLAIKNNVIVCHKCHIEWKVGPQNCVNSIQNPTLSVLSEIEGMRNENPEKFNTLDKFFYQEVVKLSTLEERISRGDLECLPKNYYLSTKKNFDYAFSRLDPKSNEKVLEIGSEHEFPFLLPFKNIGCECYACNLFFTYDTSAPIAQPVLGDMNLLPFRSNQFDYLILSATSHHSPNLPGLIAEITRVTKVGGYILLLNDPTAGFFKHTLDWIGFGSPKGGSRDHEINENEYSVRQYLTLAKKNNLAVIESFFSVYYDEKLQSGEVTGVRLAPLAKFISFFWRINFFKIIMKRYGLYFGQSLIGLEMNLILKKQ